MVKVASFVVGIFLYKYKSMDVEILNKKISPEIKLKSTQEIYYNILPYFIFGTKPFLCKELNNDLEA